jgi:thioredoxin-like negative regulator of GroEL
LLGEVRVDRTKAMTIVPASAVAALQAVLYLRDDELSRDWRSFGERSLAQIGPAAATRNTDECAAEANLRQLLGDTDGAAAAFERAMAREPKRLDYVLQLARLRFEQRDFSACDKLAEKVIQADPAGVAGDEGRALRSKVELASAAGRQTPAAGN